MTELTVTVAHTDGRMVEDTIQVGRIANLGLASRKPPQTDVLETQLSMMADAGVNRPTELPTIVPKPAHLITTRHTIQVNSSNTAGEAEFVLLIETDRTYVGVGNDHKDRDLERSEMHKANSSCPSVISDHVWVLDEIRDHWDDLELRSWVAVDGGLQAHQRATLLEFMEPETIIERVDRRTCDPLPGTAIWSGTVGVGEAGVDPFPKVVPGSFYVVQLYDPILERRLLAHYAIQVNDWIAGS